MAIDFDGTLVENPTAPLTTDDYFRADRPIGGLYGAKEVTAWLKEQGFEILVYTCRQDYQRAYIEKQLVNAGITWDYIVFYAKPHADLYIDDKGFRFTNWLNTKNWIKGQLDWDDEVNEILREE